MAKFDTKLLFYRIVRGDTRWHIAFPTMVDTSGFYSFCGIRAWAFEDTMNRHVLEMKMQRTRTEFCDKCAEELIIAFDELKKQNYIP